MLFHYTPYMLPLLGAALIAMGVAWYAWPRRIQVISAGPLTLLAGALTLWSVGYALEIAGDDLATKLFWGKVQYLGIATAPVFWLAFAIHHTNRGQWLPLRYRIGVSVLPMLTVLLVFTTDAHGWVWQTITLKHTGSFSALQVTYGFWFWIHSAYSYLLLLAGALIILRSIGRRQGLYRGQTVALIVAVLAPWAGNILYLSGLSPISYLDLTPFAFTITIVALSWGIFSFQLTNLAPVARDMVIEQMHDGMIVLDAQGRITDINLAAQRILERPAAQVVGRMATDVLSSWPDLVQRYKDVLETLDEITVTEGETQLWYELRVAPLYDRRSLFMGRAIILHNITDRKNAEKQLRQLSRAVEASPVSIVITDAQGQIEYVNPKFTQTTGYTPQEALGQNPRILKTEYTSPGVYPELWQTLQSGQEWRGQFCNRKKNGELFWELASISPITDGAGQITHYVAVKEDITERRQLEKLRDDLIHTMVHDLRNPLSGILTSLQLVERYSVAALPEKSTELLQIARHSSERMLDLVNAILDINRLESGEMPLNYTSVALTEVLREVLQYQSPLIAEKNLQLRNMLTPALPPVRGDRRLIGRVLQNLVGNAIKFTPARGAIRITATADDNWMEVAVSNTGPGIDPDIKPRLFQKFVSGAAEGRGSGLGLAFCRLVVETHGGQISAESEPEQETIFRFTLPLAQE